MQIVVAGVVLLATVVAIACCIVVIYTAIPAVSGVSGAFRPFMLSMAVGMAAFYVAHSLTDYVAAPEVKALKAAEDALHERQDAARQRKLAAAEAAAQKGQLEARKQKLKEDLDWERIQNDPAVKAKFEAEQAADNVRKRQAVIDSEHAKVAAACDREVETWPDRRLPVRCNPPEIRQFMHVTPQGQEAARQDVAQQQQEKLDRADAERCDVYFQNWPNGRASARCSEPRVQKLMRTRAAAQGSGSTASSQQ